MAGGGRNENFSNLSIEKISIFSHFFYLTFLKNMDILWNHTKRKCKEMGLRAILQLLEQVALLAHQTTDE